MHVGAPEGALDPEGEPGLAAAGGEGGDDGVEGSLAGLERVGVTWLEREQPPSIL